jgi:NNP family nitrate/nitrite transporter-like MFS transporter
VLPLDVASFTALLFVVAVGMGIGKASVYKYIPNYYPQDVGAVGGLVGLLGALGGFFLPKVFGWLGRESGFPQAAFVALLVLTLGSLVWLQLAIWALRARAASAYLAPSAPDLSPMES